MTFKNCIENFPIYDTLIGRYDSEQTFTVTDPHDVDHIERWDDNPFWEDSSCYSFVVFEPQETIIQFKKFIEDHYPNQGAAAEALHISRSHLNKIINRRDNPSTTLLLRMEKLMEETK